jgi:hypothetical protein
MVDLMSLDPRDLENKSIDKNRKKPRGKPRGFCLLKNRKEEDEAFRSWQAWQRPTLPSLET